MGRVNSSECPKPPEAALNRPIQQVRARDCHSEPVTWLRSSMVRAYWSVPVLALFAIVLLAVGSQSLDKGDGLLAAGWVATGAAIVRWVDVVQERTRARAKAEEDRRRDLDETRRLLYVELLSDPSHPTALATLVNAMAHHGLAVDPVEALTMFRTKNDQGRKWIVAQIANINDQLDGSADRR